MPRKKKRNWAIIIGLIGIILASIGLIINYSNLMNNLAPPKLEVGQYQSEPYIMVSNSVTATVTQEIQTTTITKITNATLGYNLYNITYQVRNSGKGTAHNILVTGWVEPSSNCSVTSTFVYIGSPLSSDYLRTVDNAYNISLLGAGESYVFRFQMKDNNLVGQSIFHIDVTSDDAGKLSKELIFNY
jgi:hypothetical protein